MDPPIKSEDDRVLVAENDDIYGMGLHAPRWLNKSF
jgi:hypothetical protein